MFHPLPVVWLPSLIGVTKTYEWRTLTPRRFAGFYINATGFSIQFLGGRAVALARNQRWAELIRAI
jgi:hypothetical protein